MSRLPISDPHPEAAPAIDIPREVDIAIVGAGPVGLALAGWLASRSATQALSVALIDARDAAQATDAAHADPRALALSHGSRALLEGLAWPADATPIKHIHISQRGHFGRTLIDHREHQLPALGYVVRYARLVASLAQALRGRPLLWLKHCSAQCIEQDPDGATLLLQHGNDSLHLRARVVINAEGGLYQGTPQASTGETRSGAAGGAGNDVMAAASAPGTETRGGPDCDKTGAAAHGKPSGESATARPRAPHLRDYGQSALVATVRVARPRVNTAWERFTPEGPLALLPLGRTDAAGAHRDEFALVWCGGPEAAQARLALPETAFLQALQHAFGERMGTFTQVSGRATFALGLRALREPVRGRIAAIGNAAQTLHPVAGQGLNLGLRDAHGVLEALAQHGATPAALQAFAGKRTLDRRLTIAATDLLARLFTVDLAPLAALRGGALAALDFVPAAKRGLARQMMFGQRR
jgi:2-octaprenyl-6-methoxyphenol hydroxylase